jgi:hypothetical protein
MSFGGMGLCVIVIDGRVRCEVLEISLFTVLISASKLE